MSIESVASAVPSVCHDAEEIARQTGASAEFIRNKVGIEKRYVLGEDETGVGLAQNACKKLFEKSGLTSDSVDVLVFVTQTPDRRLPQNSAQLAAGLLLPNSVAAFDLSLGCSGFVYGLAVVESLLATLKVENGLLVTCDPYSRIMRCDDKSTNAVFGDAATATWISKSGNRSIVEAFDFGTDGDNGEAIRIEAGGASRPLVSLMHSENVEGYERRDLSLTMVGCDVFKFVMRTIPLSIQACLCRAGLSRDDIELFALHQGSLYLLRNLANRSEIPEEKLLLNIQDYGNTVSSTIPMLLETASDDGLLAKKRVLISGFGVGLSWATSILKFEW